MLRKDEKIFKKLLKKPHMMSGSRALCKYLNIPPFPDSDIDLFFTSGSYATDYIRQFSFYEKDVKYFNKFLQIKVNYQNDIYNIIYEDCKGYLSILEDFDLGINQVGYIYDSKLFNNIPELITTHNFHYYLSKGICKTFLKEGIDESWVLRHLLRVDKYSKRFPELKFEPGDIDG